MLKSKRFENRNIIDRPKSELVWISNVDCIQVKQLEKILLTHRWDLRAWRSLKPGWSQLCGRAANAHWPFRIRNDHHLGIKLENFFVFDC